MVTAMKEFDPKIKSRMTLSGDEWPKLTSTFANHPVLALCSIVVSN